MSPPEAFVLCVFAISFLAATWFIATALAGISDTLREILEKMK